MTRILWCVCAAVCLALTVSCTSSHFLYRQDVFAGKKALEQGEFGQARALFAKAAAEQKRATALAFAATASYKMNDLPSAEGYVFDAEQAPGGTYVYLRILGYKALILLKEGKREEGLAALKAYLDYYRLLYPLMSIDEVRSIWKKGEVDQEQLEALLDEEIINFEQELEQAVSTGTGYYSTRPPAGIPLHFLPD